MVGKAENLVDDILETSIKLLETLNIYKEMNILDEYALIGSRFDDDINSYIESNIINELEKQYLESENREFTDTQISLLDSLYNKLNVLDKLQLYKLNPDSLFYNKENQYEDNFDGVFGKISFGDSFVDETPVSIRTLKVRLQLLFDFFNNLILQGYNNKCLKNLYYVLQDRIDLIEEVYKDSYTPIFTAKLNLALEKAGLSQNKLAKLMGVRQATVNPWFTGKTQPSLPRTVEIAKYLNVSLDYLLRPDANEMFLTGDYISQETGLSLGTINEMKNLKNNSYYSKHITKLIELLILNYNKSNTDLLTEIANYLKPTYEKNMYLISDDELNTLAENIIEDCNNIREVKAKIKDFTHFIEKEVLYKTETIYDVSNIQLQNITKILIRIKDSLINEEL